MAILVSSIQANPSSNIYLTFQVVSPVTQTGAEALIDDDATEAQINAAIAEAARQACRQNGEDVDTDAPVLIFGAVVQVG